MKIKLLASSTATLTPKQKQSIEMYRRVLKNYSSKSVTSLNENSKTNVNTTKIFNIIFVGEICSYWTHMLDDHKAT